MNSVSFIGIINLPLLLWVLFLYLTPIAVFSDATAHKIRQSQGEKRGFLKGWSALNWALFNYFLPPAGLIVYCIKRSSLVRNARLNPVSVTKGARLLTILLLLIIGLPYLTFYYKAVT